MKNLWRRCFPKEEEFVLLCDTFAAINLAFHNWEICPQFGISSSSPSRQRKYCDLISVLLNAVTDHAFFRV